jgi:hypothetical protein
MMRRGLGDRRLKARFDIVGALTGTLDVTLSLLVKEVGRGGARVESGVQLQPGSLHWTTFSGGGVDTSVQVRVRHAQPIAGAAGEARFLVGVEFISPSPALIDLVDRWLAANGEGIRVEGSAS